MAIVMCPRCGCCSLTNPTGRMRCYGGCDIDGRHETETIEDLKEIIAQKDAEITILKRLLRAPQ